MFSLVNGIYDSYLAPTQLNLLVVGPPGVGKTALLERLKATALPRRPRKPPSLSLDALPQTLEQAFQPPGAPSEIQTTTATPQKTPTKNASSSRSSSSFVSPSPSSIVVTQARRRGFALLCPAPERYRNSKDDQDEEFVQDDNDDNDDDDEPPSMRTRSHSKEFSMDEISDIIGTSESQDAAAAMPQSTRTPTKATKATEIITIMEESPSLLQSNFEEVDRKPKTKMLPLSKITPTIGTNLAKIEMYGAKVNLFDVGGRMQDLWERYYDDCDGVVFCWKLGGDDPEAEPDSDDNDQEEEPFDMSQQQEILNQVRKAIPDDVPFLIFGHVFGNVDTKITNNVYATNLLLPHYHNPMTGLCCGSAKTGAGVQSAMEWLIPLAKRQQKERVARKEQKEQAPKKL